MRTAKKCAKAKMLIIGAAIIVLMACVECETAVIGPPPLVGMVNPQKEIELNYLRQEPIPFVDYKYIIRTILPKQGMWWKRGTHHFYLDEPKPAVISV